MAFYTYSNERYEPCTFPNSIFYGTPEGAFDRHPPIRPEPQPVLDQRGAEQIPALCGPPSYADQAVALSGGALRMPRLRGPLQVDRSA